MCCHGTAANPGIDSQLSVNSISDTVFDTSQVMCKRCHIRRSGVGDGYLCCVVFKCCLPLFIPCVYINRLCSECSVACDIVLSVAEPQQHRYSTVYEGEEILRSQPVLRLDLARSPSPYQPPVMAPARQSMSPRVYEDPTYMMERAVRSPRPLDVDVVDSKPSATVHTVLYAQSTGPFLTYQHTSWQLNLRKEVCMGLPDWLNSWKLSSD